MKPSIPKGTRDFSPEEVNKRNFIFDTIREVFVRYGYQPIETPAMENLSTLTGKYGEEGDKLLFKVLNNGDFLAKADEEALDARDSSKLIPSISKRGLRYDLTVPFARFVVMRQHEVTFPFKRYQIQPVWRADRPQKGRYQEFYQCDVDVVGSDSLVYEAELAQIYDEVFAKLGMKVAIKINNRKVLAGIAEAAGISDSFMDMTISIDKLDKIGMEGVEKEMAGRDIPDSAIEKVKTILEAESIEELKPLLANSATGLKGIEELETVFDYLGIGESTNDIVFDITLARGLSYYTGCIFEVEAKGVKMGSIGGGGRYDDLTGVFGMPGTSGVGVSFGAERIFDVMEELKLFPLDSAIQLKVVFLSFDEASHRYAFRCLRKVRAAGINAEIYPEPTKMGKQFKYVDKRNAPHAIVIGSDEMASGKLAFKNMKTGEQESLSLEEIIERLRG
ncbi:MAG: histidine--tRNA ligase [Lewinellaceae bacterium]|nr:histidine--tRNA ligase [Lewinellaceae bacterium]MCB9285956.1 histidine--tRNA ligase [Lewinellaceae bacterium]